MFDECWTKRSKQPHGSMAFICATPTLDILHEAASDRIITEM